MLLGREAEPLSEEDIGGQIARTEAKRREHAIEIYRCDLHRRMGIGRKYNQDCRYSPRLHTKRKHP
jgi:hypothetical protein